MRAPKLLLGGKTLEPKARFAQIQPTPIAKILISLLDVVTSKWPFKLKFKKLQLKRPVNVLLKERSLGSLRKSARKKFYEFVVRGLPKKKKTLA
jgi:hypothetical protein